jgi:glycosyltransferase involved in cell wall biosynthesis
MTPKYSIIVTTKNEECGIAKVLCSIPNQIKKESEIIVVDSSKDLTPVIAEQLGATVIIEPKRGKGRAMRHGVEQSRGDILIFLDGDGTDPAQFIPELVKNLDEYDLVLGSRTAKSFKQDSKLYRAYFLPYQLVVGTLFKDVVGFKISGDPLAGFRAIKRANWDKLKLESDGFEIEAEMDIKSLRCGFKVGEVPIPLIKRSGGLLKSKLVTSPRMQLKIFDVALRYVEEEKIKANLVKFRGEFEERVFGKKTES